MIIELILATDLMRHYELVSAFNKKVSSPGPEVSRLSWQPP